MEGEEPGKATDRCFFQRDESQNVPGLGGGGGWEGEQDAGKG